MEINILFEWTHGCDALNSAKIMEVLDGAPCWNLPFWTGGKRCPQT